MADIKINEYMDIEIKDGDIVIDDSLETAIRLTLSTSSDWWGESGGGKLYNLTNRAKMDNDLVRKAVQIVKKDLSFLNEYGTYEVEVYRHNSALVVEVSLMFKDGRWMKWTIEPQPEPTPEPQPKPPPPSTLSELNFTEDGEYSFLVNGETIMSIVKAIIWVFRFSVSITVVISMKNKCSLWIPSVIHIGRVETIPFLIFKVN